MPVSEGKSNAIVGRKVKIVLQGIDMSLKIVTRVDNRICANKNQESDMCTRDFFSREKEL
eukprot:357147-Amphidinium_carterae.1